MNKKSKSGVSQKMGGRVCVGASVLGPEMGRSVAKEDCRASSSIFFWWKRSVVASTEKSFIERSSNSTTVDSMTIFWSGEILREPVSRSWLNWVPTGQDEFLIRTDFICFK